MGRMLETLKLGEGRRTPLAISKPVDAASVQDCVVDWEIGEEVPFVEVGGPNKKVAVSAALKRQLRVAVLDARGGLAERLGLPTLVGLGEVLAGTIALEQALVNTGIASLLVLPVGKPSPMTQEALAWLVVWLRERCD